MQCVEVELMRMTHDWLLDGRGRRRKERNWTVTFCSFFFCLLYLVALAGVLVSVSCFGAVQRKCGNDIYCILNIGGDVILALLCLVLLVISLFQIMHGVWSTCTLLLQFLVLIFGLLLAIVLLAYLIACSTGKKSCVPKDNDGSYIYMSQGALSVCFCALFASLAMQTLLLCCCRKRTRSTSQELDDNNWIDNDRIMKRKKYADFD
ncbi:PREDICTED: uncharacterized protein LOC100640657 [Amphimedon queenslandica]|uniref:Uncharacterized protein n=1 Tax=Amphimedon queenslandica TaxID=400682 RepID=A0AAN0IBJ1_AMPQE|nr:PREDICTED: uncharacterized protein LOC100640657 [Amphimedon queenslandica]|eukprot:XP_003384389.1 PREDICTED: uncharacterized protein LOC100640657 [Amphimedon queenslandica]